MDAAFPGKHDSESARIVKQFLGNKTLQFPSRLHFQYEKVLWANPPLSMQIAFWGTKIANPRIEANRSNAMKIGVRFAQIDSRESPWSHRESPGHVIRKILRPYKQDGHLHNSPPKTRDFMVMEIFLQQEQKMPCAHKLAQPFLALGLWARNNCGSLAHAAQRLKEDKEVTTSWLWGGWRQGYEGIFAR